MKEQEEGVDFIARSLFSAVLEISLAEADPPQFALHQADESIDAICVFSDAHWIVRSSNHVQIETNVDAEFSEET